MLETAIIQWEAEHDIAPGLVAAIVEVESSGQCYALRAEERYPWLFDIAKGPIRSAAPDVALTPIKGETSATERWGQRISWGPMQIMGATARELGFRGWFAELCGPRGIEYGCRYLARLYDRYGNWHDAIAAYNAGSARKLPDGTYPNQRYVDKVRKHWKGGA